MMTEIEPEIVQLVKPELQGNKKIIWEELSFPRSLQALYSACPSIPNSSIRRCLSEMRRDGYIKKNGKDHKGKRGVGKWQRVESKVSQ